MYLIRTYLDYSAIHGVGVFAAEDIPQGTIVWRLVSGLDRAYTPAQVATLPPAGQDFIRKYAYPYQGLLWVCSDHGLFVNHSNSPNTKSQEDRSDIAVRTIAQGEEITCDYRHFNPYAVEKMLDLAGMGAGL
jgi:hypothetical protein